MPFACLAGGKAHIGFEGEFLVITFLSLWRAFRNSAATAAHIHTVNGRTLRCARYDGKRARKPIAQILPISMPCALSLSLSLPLSPYSRSLRRATRNSLTRRFGALDGTEKEVRTHRGVPERKNGAHAKPRLRRVKEFLWPNHATMLPAVDKVCPRRLQTPLRVGWVMIKAMPPFFQPAGPLVQRGRSNRIG